MFITSISYNSNHKFTDKKHLINFIRYLLSLTQKHPNNSRTKFNYINMYIMDSGQLGLAKKETYQEIINMIEETGLEWNELVNDLCYWAYIIPINGKLFSNFATGKEEQINVESIIFDELKRLHPNIESILEKHMNDYKEIHWFDTASEQEHLILEEILEQHQLEMLPDILPLLHVSHVDQDSIHHIHRIYRK